jgi:N utilization substance protein B
VSEPDAGPDGPRSTGHRRRRAARRLAIDILFQADVTESSPSEAMREWRQAGRSVPAYAAELVEGVEGSRSEIDVDLGAHAEEWTVPRMAALDRTILRVACYEMRAGVPPAVAINEAVDAANELSTEASGRFVNGVLGKIARSGEHHDPPASPGAGQD